MARPLLINKGIVKGVETIESYGDLKHLEVVVYGTATVVLIGVLTYIIKEIWEAWKKKGDKTEDKLDYLVEAVHRMEEQISDMKTDIVPKHEVVNMIRDEIEYSHRMRTR